MTYDFGVCRDLLAMGLLVGGLGCGPKAHGTHNTPLFPAGEFLPRPGKE